MFGIDDAVLAGMAGSAIGGGLSWFGQQSANQANRKLAARQQAFQAEQARMMMDFQTRSSREAMGFAERMSSTSWQRGIEDMRRAGINPMLAFSQGGASSPSGLSASGAAGSGSSIPMQNEFGGVSAAMSSGLSVARAKADLENIRATNRKIDSDVDLNKAMTLAQQNQAVVNSNTATNLIKRAHGIDIENDLLKAKKPGAENQARYDESTFGRWMSYLGRTIDIINPLTSTAKGVANIVKTVAKKPNKMTRYDRRTGEVYETY